MALENREEWALFRGTLLMDELQEMPWDYVGAGPFTFGCEVGRD